MRTDIAPTDHAALFRFEFTGDEGNVILDNVDRDEGDSALTINAGRGHDQRLVRRRQRPLQRRRAPVRLRHVRQAGHPEREAERGRSRLDRLRQVRHEQRQGREPADRHLADEHRAGEEEPGARDPADRHADLARGARPEPVGRQARRRRGRGRHAGPEPDALLEPLPAVAVSELGARERRHRGLPRVEAHGAVLDRLAARHADPDRRRHRRRQGVRQQRLLGHLPDRLAGLRDVRPRAPPASWSTASSSSTATAAGSRAGPRRATPT